MTALDALLAVQEHDTAIDQLRHKRANLPERSAVREIDATRKSLAAERAEVAIRRDEVVERQESLEKTIAASETRIAEIDKKMYSGEITASRDLQAMTTEIASIKSRISTLEDGALEAMDEREPLDREVAELDRRDTELAAERGRLIAAIADAEAAIDSELESEQAARSDAVASVPPDLVSSYERLRARLGGIGAARLEHGTCMGCRLQLPATELDRIKHQPPDAVIHCEQCGRILVR